MAFSSANASPQYHRLSQLFPLLEGREFDELVEDVRRHGVREAIWLYEEKILDGRNRQRAAAVAGFPCPTRTYDGDDPLGFVISLNLKRRHLDTSQRAMVAARLANMRQGERTDLPSFEGRSVSQEQAAKLLNVGLASVEAKSSFRYRARLRGSGESTLASRCRPMPSAAWTCMGLLLSRGERLSILLSSFLCSHSFVRPRRNHSSAPTVNQRFGCTNSPIGAH